MLGAGTARSLGRSPPEYRHMRRYGRIPFGLTLGPNDTDGKKRRKVRCSRNARRGTSGVVRTRRWGPASSLNCGSALSRRVLVHEIV